MNLFSEKNLEKVLNILFPCLTFPTKKSHKTYKINLNYENIKNKPKELYSIHFTNLTL